MNRTRPPARLESGRARLAIVERIASRSAATVLWLVQRLLLVVVVLVSGWLVYSLLLLPIVDGHDRLVAFLGLWLVSAYLVLPRVQRLLARIYVPDYFVGRTRTSEGLLGDPVNLAAMGSEDDLVRAMGRAGWTRADDLTWRTGLRLAVCAVLRRRYPAAPVSPLFVFRRRQDLAFEQEVAGSISRRHHVRFWQCPDGWYLPGGLGVEWVGAGTYDRSIGLSLFTLQITHKIGADIDLERDHILETLQRAGAVGSVDWVRNYFSGYHSRNGGGDAIRTDGDLPVVHLEASVRDAPGPLRRAAGDRDDLVDQRSPRSDVDGGAP